MLANDELSRSNSIKTEKQSEIAEIKRELSGETYEDENSHFMHM